MAPRYFPVLIILFFASFESALGARVLDHLEIEQLCRMANLIVKVAVGDATEVSTNDGNCAVWNVKILSVLKGEAKPESVIRVAGIEEYHKGPGIEGITSGFPRLTRGEIAYLFLVPKGTRMGYSKYDLTNADWKVIESGARLVVDDKVYDFGQLHPPRPGTVPGFVAMTEKTFPNASIQSVETFEKQVNGSISVANPPATRP